MCDVNVDEEMIGVFVFLMKKSLRYFFQHEGEILGD